MLSALLLGTVLSVDYYYYYYYYYYYFSQAMPSDAEDAEH